MRYSEGRSKERQRGERAGRKKTVRFQARIYRIWMMRHVDVPEEIARELLKEWKKRAGKSDKKKAPKHLLVVATVGTKSARTTLMPSGAGRYRMQVNTALRRAAQADTGDLIGVSLRYDAESREVELPPELGRALRGHPRARRELERLPPGHKRQLLLYYRRAKSEKAREKAAQRVIEHLVERAILGTGRKKRGKEIEADSEAD